MGQKIRFGDLVRGSGRPRSITLWTAPEKDSAVVRAIKEKRILTVHENPGETPFGQLGLQPDRHAVFLLFPHPLAIDPSARVIGINYQLAEESEVPAAPQPRARKPRRKAMPSLAKPLDAKRNFTIRVRRTATITETLNTEALDLREAERKALELAKKKPFDLQKASVGEEVV